MNPAEADTVIDMIAETQKVPLLDRCAWKLVLAPLGREAAIQQIVRLKARAKYVNPCDLNSTPDDPEWGEAWAIVAANFGRIGPGGDYGHPDINSAVMACRQSLRDMPADKAQWVFKAAFSNATNPSLVLPAIEASELPALPEVTP